MWELDEEVPPQQVTVAEKAKGEVSIPMTLEDAKRAIEKAKVNLQVHLEKIKDMKAEIALLKVDSDESLATSVDLGIRAKKLAKVIEDEKDRIIKPAKEFTKLVSNFAGTLTVGLLDIEATTKTKNRSFKVIQEQRLLEAQKKIDEETETLRAQVKKEAEAAGVDAVEVTTPVLGKEKKTVRTESGIAYSSEYWKFEPGPVTRNDPTYPGIGRPRVIAYAHSQKERMIEIGEKVGLTGKPLERFKFALNEVKFELEIDEEGMATIVSVDDKLLPIIPAEFLIPDGKALRKNIDGGRHNIEGVKVWREDKEVYK